MHIVIDARIRRASTGRYTDRLVQHLQAVDTDNDYTILVQPDDDWAMTNPRFRTVPCRYEQFSFNPFEQIGFARQLYGLKPALVHFTMTQQPLFYFGKIVTTTHDLTMLRHTRASRFPAWLHSIGMLLYRFLLWSAHKKSNKIIVPTDYVAKDLANYQPFTKDKIVRTYESSEPPLPVKSKQPAGLNKPFIFHVGSPFPHKNIHRLIQSFEILYTLQPELKLVLPGKIKDQFKRDLDDWIAASPAKDAILVPGFISDPELKWMYENAECYVLPALSEGFGLPGLEAMAHGCPVASSNATCLPEVYQDAALFFDPYNVADIAAKVNTIMSDKKLAKDLVSRGHKLLPKYSWRKMAEETLAVYNSV